MPRSTLDEQIESGLLTAPSAAMVMPMSRTTIANLGRRCILEKISTPGIRETRYSAMVLLRYCVNNKLPVSVELQKAAENYSTMYGQKEEFLKLILHCKPVTAKPATEVVANGTQGT